MGGFNLFDQVTNRVGAGLGTSVIRVISTMGLYNTKLSQNPDQPRWVTNHPIATRRAGLDLERNQGDLDNGVIRYQVIPKPRPAPTYCTNIDPGLMDHQVPTSEYLFHRLRSAPLGREQQLVAVPKGHPDRITGAGFAFVSHRHLQGEIPAQ